MGAAAGACTLPSARKSVLADYFPGVVVGDKVEGRCRFGMCVGDGEHEEAALCDRRCPAADGVGHANGRRERDEAVPDAPKRTAVGTCINEALLVVKAVDHVHRGSSAVDRLAWREAAWDSAAGIVAISARADPFVAWKSQGATPTALVATSVEEANSADLWNDHLGRRDD